MPEETDGVMSIANLPAWQGQSLASLLPFMTEELESISPVLAHQLGISDIETTIEEGVIAFSGSIQLQNPLIMQFPDVKDFTLSISISNDNNSGSNATINVELYPQQIFLLSDIDISLALPSSLFTPLTRLSDGTFEIQYDDSGDILPVTIQLPRMDFSFGGADTASLESILTNYSISLEHPFEILGTGIILQVKGLRLPEPVFYDEDAPPGNVDNIEFCLFVDDVDIYLPGFLQEIIPSSSISFENISISTLGFNGRIYLEGDNSEFDFFGFRLRLLTFELQLKQNTLIQNDIQAQIFIPFIDQWVDLEIGWDQQGNLSLLLRLDTSADNSTYTIDGLLGITILGISLEYSNEALCIALETILTPKFQQSSLGTINWPQINSSMLISADGNVSIEGGWLDLPEHYSFDLLGFQFELSKIAFGKNQSGEKWLGLNGAIQLLDELPAGASVEGLIISWKGSDWSMSLAGIGIKFEVKNVLSFKGAIALNTKDNPRFEGQVELYLEALSMHIDAQLVIGKQNNMPYMGLYLGVEMPTAIPLFTTGLGIYGLEGLYVQNMQPNKQSNEDWYSWYKKPKIGITDITNQNKWMPQKNNFAFGAGLSIGTLADNGYAFSSNAILLFQFPGPIVLFAGKAALLSSRQGLHNDPPLRALAVLDGRSGALDIELDASYRYWRNGELLDIEAHASAHFELDNPYKWHLYIGEKTPLDKRIRANILSLFTAQAYFMLDATSLQMGARNGYDGNWNFYPLRVGLSSYLETHVALSYYPMHFHGELIVHGGVELAAFGFGVGMVVESKITADVFTPFELTGQFTVRLSLPYPLDNLSAGVKLRWGDDEAKAPPVPLPLKEVAIEHFSSSDSWPLTRQKTLLPDMEQSQHPGFLDTTKNTTNESVPGDAPASLPVIPMDGKPHLSFSRSVYDSSGIGGSQNNSNIQWEQIGDPDGGTGPAKLKYNLESIRLFRQINNTWQLEASSIKDEQDSTKTPPVSKLFGSWAPMPSIPLNDPQTGLPVGANNKLWLWSKNPFDYTRRSSSGWNEQFLETFADYPCIPDYEPKPVSYNFDNIANGEVAIARPNAHQDGNPLERVYFYPTPDLKLIYAWRDLLLSDQYKPYISNTRSELQQQTSHWHSLYFPSQGSYRRQLDIQFDQPQYLIEIILSATAPPAEIIPYNYTGAQLEDLQQISTQAIHTLSFNNISSVSIDYTGELCIYAVNIARYNEDEVNRLQHREQLLQEYLENWQDLNHILQAYSIYSLAIETRVEVKDVLSSIDLSDEVIMEHAYFSVGGPPGLAHLSIPKDLPNKDNRILSKNGIQYLKTPLNSLSPYIDATQPAQKQISSLVNAAEQDNNQPVLIQPVYRSYDINIRFSDLTENVGTMYQMAQRSLSLVIYDKDGTPLHDGESFQRISNRLIQSPNKNTAAVTQHFYDLISSKTCLPVDTIQFEQPIVFTATTNKALLQSDKLHRIALVPHILDENFSQGLENWSNINGELRQALTDWFCDSYNRQQGSSAQILRNNIIQLSDSSGLPNIIPGLSEVILHQDTYRTNQRYRILNMHGDNQVTLDASPDFSHNDTSEWTLVALSYCEHQNTTDTNNPEIIFSPLRGWHDLSTIQWQNYRYNATIYISDIEQLDLALLFRVNQEESGRVIFNEKQLCIYDLLGEVFRADYSELTELVDINTNEADATTSLPENTLVSLALEVENNTLRVFINDQLLVTRSNLTLPATGGIGIMHTRPNGGMLKFLSIEIENFSSNQSVYEFSLISSIYYHFYHQLNDFNHQLETISITSVINDEFAISLTSPKAISSAEFESHDMEAQAIFGSEAFNLSKHLQLFSLKNNISTTSNAFYLKSPEPFDSSRTSLTLEYSSSDTSVIDDTNSAVSAVNIMSERLIITDYYPVNSLAQQRGQSPATSPAHIELLKQDEQSLNGYRIEYLNPRYQQELLATPTTQNQFLSDWQVINEAPYSKSHSRWRVENKMIIQTSNYYGFTGGIINRAGTFAITGEAHWENYNYQLKVLSSDNDTIGAMFCYQDSNNYFRFVMDHERSFRRLIRKKNGITKLLWEDRKVFKLNQWIKLKFKISHKKISAYVNNTKIFKIRDRSNHRGKAGIYCRANKGAQFKAIHLTIAGEQWLPLYVFNQTDNYPAGTRIALVFSSQTSDILDNNFIIKNISHVQLQAMKLSLRIRDNLSGITMQMTFPEDTQYRNKNLKVLRKQDATAMFLLPSRYWSAGNYRLTIRYDRKILDNDTDLPASENGEISAEYARLYFTLK